MMPDIASANLSNSSPPVDFTDEIELIVLYRYVLTDEGQRVVAEMSCTYCGYKRAQWCGILCLDCASLLPEEVPEYVRTGKHPRVGRAAPAPDLGPVVQASEESLAAAKTVQSWVLNADHAIALWVDSDSMAPWCARCKCGWHSASAHGGLRNWNADGHAQDVLKRPVRP